MITKLFKNKTFQAVLALIISIILWSYIVVNTNPDYTVKLDVTNIEYIGLDELTADDFYIIGNLPGGAEVKVAGTRNLVTKVDENYKVSMDFSEIKSAGEYTIPIKATVPDRVEIKSIRPEVVKVKVDVGRRKIVETSLNITGKNTEKYNITLLNNEITVSGPSSVIALISRCEVKVDTDNIEKTGKAVYKAVAVDADGNEIVYEDLTFNNAVSVEISEIKNVAVEINERLIPEYIKNLYDVEISYSPRNVNICGGSEEIEKIEKIEADLSYFVFDASMPVQETEVGLKIPEEIELLKGEKETVKITFKYTLKETAPGTEGSGDGELTAPGGNEDKVEKTEE